MFKHDGKFYAGALKKTLSFVPQWDNLKEITKKVYDESWDKFDYFWVASGSHPIPWTWFIDVRNLK